MELNITQIKQFKIMWLVKTINSKYPKPWEIILAVLFVIKGA